ncbi:BON domain-containing protein [Aliifodinibius sp. S!AR15-10]|uniref:BON domain-containing protein n=1 Tax=Aliifodinibius sp. S!AR15-10 TaxID=2950437 RepID=UPI002858E909|nr:BON domain-containing protein [Aliifodinibius sp. S!AR15-10]MDR8392488.1 BON domain-containing protein [Aliifodinibius sp. S!AR15-10]
MKSPGFAQRFPLSKIFVVLLSLIFVVFISSCTQNESTDQVAELPSDQEVTQTIRAQLDATTQIPSDSISIETQDGIVTLSGGIDNLLVKKEANKIAQSTYGVLAVVNQLKIEASRPDDAVDKDVDTAISTDAAMESWKITSQVNNGIVTLEGVVDTWQERQLVATVASGVKGVKGINNNLVVNYDQSRTDEEIKAEVEQRLKMNSQVNSNMIKVDVTDGNVTLTGAIGSAYEKSLAQDLARVTGVKSVAADRLEVHPEYDNAMFSTEKIETLTADQVREAIVSTFRYDPRVPEDKVSVQIENNTAILEGSVVNLNSKLAAESDARNTAGVNEVINNIEVEHKIVVEPGVPTTDEAITQRLANAIDRDPYVEKTAVTLKVEGGLAKIDGTVNSQFEKEQLNKIASNVKGVIAINNSVEVTAGGQDT